MVKKRTITIIQIAIPVILIVISSIEIMKSIVKDSDEMKKAYSSVLKKIVAAIIIFFIPIAVEVIFEILNIGLNNKCFKCFMYTNRCTYIIKAQSNKESNTNNSISSGICSESENKNICCKDIYGSNASFDSQINDCIKSLSDENQY